MHFIRPVRFLLIDALMLYLSKNGSVLLVGIKRFTAIRIPPPALEQGKRLLYSALVSIGTLFRCHPLAAILPIYFLPEFEERIMKVARRCVDPLFLCCDALDITHLVVWQIKMYFPKTIHLGPQSGQLRVQPP